MTGFQRLGCQRFHVQGSANSGAPTPDSSPASHRAAVAVEGNHPDQRGDLPVAQRTELRQESQKREGDLLSNSGNGAQELILLPPYGTAANGLSQVCVQVLQLPLQPLNVGLDAGAYGDGGGGVSGGSSPRPA